MSELMIKKMKNVECRTLSYCKHICLEPVLPRVYLPDLERGHVPRLPPRALPHAGRWPPRRQRLRLQPPEGEEDPHLRLQCRQWKTQGYSLAGEKKNYGNKRFFLKVKLKFTIIFFSRFKGISI